MNHARHRLALAASLLAIAAPKRAHAGDSDTLLATFVSPGYVESFAMGRRAAHGGGFEISAGTWVDGPRSPPMLTLTSKTLMLGAVFRTQGYDGEGGSYGRRAVAAEIGWSIFGVEVGHAWRDATIDGAAISGLHLAPYASIGFFYVGTQHIVPLGGASAPGQIGFELNVGLKIPIAPLWLAALGGLANLGKGGAGGRPLEVDGAPRVASVVRRRAWSLAPANRVTIAS